MASILLVCTGNICRSPIAEGLVRRLVEGCDGRIEVSSVGIIGWEGSPAIEESVEAAGELGADISRHVARRLEEHHVAGADLVVCMAGEHRDAVTQLVPGAVSRTFTLKELVRLLEELPPPEPGLPVEDLLRDRVKRADRLRREGFAGNPHDENVSDPLGMSLDMFRAIAWDVNEWSTRMIAGLLGRTPEAAAVRAEGADDR